MKKRFFSSLCPEFTVDLSAGIVILIALVALMSLPSALESNQPWFARIVILLCATIIFLFVKKIRNYLTTVKTEENEDEEITG